MIVLRRLAPVGALVLAMGLSLVAGAAAAQGGRVCSCTSDPVERAMLSG